MKLWILQNKPDLGEDDPWEPWYDRAFGFIVAAPDEQSARVIATRHAGDEAHRWTENYANRDETHAWTDPKYSTCKELTAESYAAPTMVLRDFASA